MLLAAKTRHMHTTASTSIHQQPRVNVVHSAHETTPRILVVDDQPDALTIMRLLLEHHGFQVMTAASVHAAFRQMQASLPDLIMTDYLMPELTGLDLCRHVRRDRLTRRIPIVLHTGSDLPETEPGLYDDVFAKPADLSRLVQRIRRLISLANMPARGPINAR